MKNIKTTIIIPTHNEEKIVLCALRSLEKQSLDELLVEVIVVPNGCSDKTASVVSDFSHNSKNSNLMWRIEALEEGHRTRALNHGISLSDTDITMYLNPDCLLEKNAVRSMFNKISSSQTIKVLGMFGEPDLSSISTDLKLYQTQLLLTLNRRISKRIIPTPEGRFIAYRNRDFPKLPEELHSEDVWLSLYSYKKYGLDSICILFEPVLKYLPYQNWVDLMRVESRYLEGTKQVFTNYPEFENIFDEIKKLREISEDEKVAEVHEFCMHNNIDINLALGIRDVIFPIVRENAKIMQQITPEGKWDLIKHVI